MRIHKLLVIRYPVISSGSHTLRLLIWKSRRRDINSVNKASEVENEMLTLSNHTTKTILNSLTSDHTDY